MRESIGQNDVVNAVIELRRRNGGDENTVRLITAVGAHILDITTELMETISELKPCPFCGSKAMLDVETDDGCDGNWYFVYCQDMTCGGRSDGWAKIEDAVKKWNNRSGRLISYGTAETENKA